MHDCFPAAACTAAAARAAVSTPAAVCTAAAAAVCTAAATAVFAAGIVAIGDPPGRIRWSRLWWALHARRRRR
jgi:hypothetical protein